jgi:Protein of unknown function (DUF998)
MNTTFHTPSGASTQSARPGQHSANTLLARGALAGPLRLATVAAPSVVRDGFNPTRHTFSLLANGHAGWIQRAIFAVAGVLLVLGAVGPLKRTRASAGFGRPRRVPASSIAHR